MAAKKGPRRSPRQPDQNPDMKDVMDQTAEDDAQEQKLGEAAKTIKRAHLLSKEAQQRLSACRLATSPTSAIKHDIERVREICGELADDCVEALKQLRK